MKCPICLERKIYKDFWSCEKCSELLTAKEYNDAIIFIAEAGNRESDRKLKELRDKALIGFNANKAYKKLAENQLNLF